MRGFALDIDQNGTPERRQKGAGMLYNIHLQLFAEGGGEAGGGSENAAGFDVDAEIYKRFGNVPGVAAPKKQAETKTEAPKPDADEGEKGKADAEQKTDENNTPENEDAEFEALIKGKYKNAYGKRVQNTVNDRFKSHSKALSEAQQELADWKEAVGPYLAKLGVDPNDLEAVRAAAMDDQSNFRSRALAENITIEEAIQRYQDERATQKQQAEQQRLIQEAQERAEMEKQAAEYEGWKKEAEAIQKDDPGFDLTTEINNNPAFAGLLDKGVSVTDAYRATHYEANMAKIAGAVEQQTALNTARQIAAGSKRPAEGGLKPTGAINTKSSVADLSDKEFMKLFKSMGF